MEGRRREFNQPPSVSQLWAISRGGDQGAVCFGARHPAVEQIYVFWGLDDETVCDALEAAKGHFGIREGVGARYVRGSTEALSVSIKSLRAYGVALAWAGQRIRWAGVYVAKAES